MKHRVQLDGLRALAVLQVLLWHFWPDFPGLSGHRGVQLFFVLSGFLITSILLDCRRLVATGAAPSRRFVLGRFYARRFLRIVPPYDLLLLVLASTRSAGVRPNLGVHLAYLTNFYFAALGEFQPWVLAHVWTLATEEQFYLLWPLLILWLPARWLRIRGPLTFMVASSLTVALAAASFRWLETPINRHKSRFSYRASEPHRQAQAV